MGNQFRDTSRTGKRYAILFSGTADPWTLNDLEFCWRLLTDPSSYNVDPNDIRVLYFSGKLETNDANRPATFFPSATPSDRYRIRVDKPGTAAEFSNACLALSPLLQSQDLVFIHANGHGSVNSSGQPYLLTFDNAEFTADMFSTHLGLLTQHASLLITMQQCYGAGFMNPVVNAWRSHRIHAQGVSFACASNGISYANNVQSFSRFTWGWVAAHLDADNFGNPLTPAVTKDNNGFIEAAEAYNYAKRVADPREHPRTRNRPGTARDITLA